MFEYLHLVKSENKNLVEYMIDLQQQTKLKELAFGHIAQLSSTGSS